MSRYFNLPRLTLMNWLISFLRTFHGKVLIVILTI